jgi:phosphate transport system substrate-binding protein
VQARTGFKRALPALLCFALLSAPASCGSSTGGHSTAEGGDLQGTITISGAWALYPLMVRWGEEFQKLHPDVRFDISAGGAGKGMADALANAVDIGMVSREIYAEEVEKGAFWVSVTKDAVFPTVSEGNPVWEDLRQQGIDQETFIGIYITGEIGWRSRTPSICSPAPTLVGQRPPGPSILA